LMARLQPRSNNNSNSSSHQYGSKMELWRKIANVNICKRKKGETDHLTQNIIWVSIKKNWLL
jgi:hypothetical protein